MVVQGVTGRVASDVNGRYDPTDKLVAGMPVFVRKGDPRKIIEYYAPLNRWQIKPASGTGSDLCWAYMEAEQGKLPNEASKYGMLWTGRGDGSWWIEQRDVKMVEAEGGKYLEVTGFVGQHASKINGKYLNNGVDLDSGLPSYVKPGAVDKWLEYHPATKTWQVKPPVDKGRDACWAFNVNPRGSYPHKVTSVWVAKDAFEPQPGGSIAAVDL